MYVLSDAQNLVTLRIVLTESQEAWRKRKKENRVLFSPNIFFGENKKCTGKQWT
jgi:hypothetical protein